eukprot:8713181-Prorocentrum_lima.AAC.1
MTSSLVGSEMCIRDSMQVVSKGSEVPARNPYPRWERLTHARRCMDASWTVSYTHLTLPTICSV